MKFNKFVDEVESIDLGLKNLEGLSFAIYEALFRGTFKPETYEGAVIILQEEVQRLSARAEKIVASLYEEKNKK